MFIDQQVKIDFNAILNSKDKNFYFLLYSAFLKESEIIYDIFFNEELMFVATKGNILSMIQSLISF